MEDVIERQDGAELGTQRFAADANSKYHVEMTPKVAAHYDHAPINEDSGRIAPEQ